MPDRLPLASKVQIIGNFALPAVGTERRRGISQKPENSETFLFLYD
jgi:hypothetical protein